MANRPPVISLPTSFSGPLLWSCYITWNSRKMSSVSRPYTSIPASLSFWDALLHHLRGKHHLLWEAFPDWQAGRPTPLPLPGACTYTPDGLMASVTFAAFSFSHSTSHSPSFQSCLCPLESLSFIGNRVVSFLFEIISHFSIPDGIQHYSNFKCTL